MIFPVQSSNSSAAKPQFHAAIAANGYWEPFRSHTHTCTRTHSHACIFIRAFALAYTRIRKLHFTEREREREREKERETVDDHVDLSIVIANAGFRRTGRSSIAIRASPIMSMYVSIAIHRNNNTT